MKTLLIISSLMLGLGGCATFSAEPIAAQVVDADTGQPIEGVVVVAHWELHGGSFTGDALPCGVTGVEEAVTDQEGRFHLSGFGPIRVSCEVQIWNPMLIFFKPGYEPYAVHNSAGAATTNPLETVSVSRSDWNGKTITLTKNHDMDLLSDKLGSYASYFNGMNVHQLSFVMDYAGGCYWKKIPNMLRAVMEQEKIFREAGNSVGSIATQLVIDDKSMQEHAPQCGSPKAFIEVLGK